MERSTICSSQAVKAIVECPASWQGDQSSKKVGRRDVNASSARHPNTRSHKRSKESAPRVMAGTHSACEAKLSFLLPGMEWSDQYSVHHACISNQSMSTQVPCRVAHD